MIRRYAGLIAIILAGLSIRLIAIDKWPLWGDEALTLVIAEWPVKYLFLAGIDPTPGLYYVLHKLFLGPMVDAATARSISLVCGTLLIPAAYRLAREARIPALLTATLVALSFPLIDYSQEARAYALLVLLVTCSAACFVRWTKSQRQTHLLLALLFAVLAFYTHLASIFWIGPMLLAALWIGRRQAILPVLLFAILSVPEVGRTLSYRPGNFSWLAQASAAEARNTLARALLPFRPEGLWAAAAALLIGWRLWVHRSKIAEWAKGNRGAAVVLLILLIAPLLIWIFGLVAKPIFMTRTILLAIPGFMLGLALLLRFEHRLARFGVAAFYAASLLVTGTTRPKDEWRAIAGRIGGDALLMCQPWQAPAMRHALTGGNQMLLRYDDGLREVWGEPWPRAFLGVLKSRERLEVAKRRGEAADLDSFPVWPVRSGKIEEMPAAPATLRQAIAFCDSYRVSDRQRSYLAD